MGCHRPSPRRVVVACSSTVSRLASPSCCVLAWMSTATASTPTAPTASSTKWLPVASTTSSVTSGYAGASSRTTRLRVSQTTTAALHRDQATCRDGMAAYSLETLATLGESHDAPPHRRTFVIVSAKPKSVSRGGANGNAQNR